MTLRELCNDAHEAIKSSKRYMTIYEAVGTITEPMSDEDLMNFLKDECNAATSIRSYLTEQTIWAVINEIKYSKEEQ